MTTAADTDYRGELAAGMVHVATRLAGHVRDWDQPAATDLLGRLSPAQQRALCVVLAAMVDVDQTPADLLAWLDTDPEPGPIVDEVAVERAAAGEHVTLTRAEKAAAAELILARGHPVTRIADRLRVSGTTARKLAQQARQEAA